MYRTILPRCRIQLMLFDFKLHLWTLTHIKEMIDKWKVSTDSFKLYVVFTVNLFWPLQL